jgi:hypothetical protein
MLTLKENLTMRNEEMYEVIAKIAMKFIDNAENDGAACQRLGEATANTLREEYGIQSAHDYVVIAAPLMIGEALGLDK